MKNKLTRKLRCNRGDVSILTSFIILIAIITGSFALSTVVLTTLKGLRNAGSSTTAFYAADTGAERGLFDFNWSPSDTSVTACEMNNVDVNLNDNPVTSYKLLIDNGQGDCPSYEEVAAGNTTLCIEAQATASGTQRRILNGIFSSAGTCPNR